MKLLKSISLFAAVLCLIACGSGDASHQSSEEKAVLTAEVQPESLEPVTNATTIVEDAAPAEAKPARDVARTSSETATKPMPARQQVDESEVIEKQEVVAEDETVIPAKPTHEQWDALLRKYVTANGKVNYAGLKKDNAALESYLGGLTRNPVQDDWSRNEKMTYWINAYNAFTVKLIVDNYPVTSIMKLHNGKAWDVKWIQLGKQTYSLNNIENDILRPKYKDARIHFAVNCAAESCPPLLNRAFTADQLDRQLEQQAKAFINSAKYNSINTNSVAISKIFEWYAGDFGNIIDYLNQYSDTKINAGATVKYQEYDWGLNAK